MKGSDLFHRFAIRESFTGFYPPAARSFKDYPARAKAIRFGVRIDSESEAYGTC
jgi:hypothetical protein